MEKVSESNGNRAVLSVQILLLLSFYIFASGVFTFLGYAVYRSLVNRDAWVHAVIIATIITFAFSILISVITMVFTVLIREGRKQVSDNGGLSHEKEI